MDGPGADGRLQLALGALGDHSAAVDDGDPGRQLVGLVQVLRGQQHGGALGDHGPHDVPHLVAAARVEAGRRLVEEQQVGGAEDGGGDVDPAPHTARVVLDLLRGGLREPEGLQELGGAAPGGLLVVAEQPAQQDQVLGAGEVLVHRRVLAGEAHPGAHLVRLADDVVAEDMRLAAVRPQECGEHLHGGGLAGAVRAEDAVDRAGGHGQVYSVDGPGLAERLHQARGLDRQAGRLRAHVSGPSEYVGYA